jgi:chaperone modulatory protein CbpM
MITIDILCARFPALSQDDLWHWIGEGHIRPDRVAGEPEFAEIDVERVRLILELRDRLEVNEAALPVVLSLLDQLYELRRRLRAMGVALDAG